MLLKAAAIFVLLHGLVHLIGVIAFWKLGLRDQYSTKILGGAVDIGEVGTYGLGAAWLFVTIGYVVAAYLMFFAQPNWRAGLGVITVFSLVLTILGWKDTILGTVVNVIILVVLLVA